MKNLHLVGIVLLVAGMLFVFSGCAGYYTSQRERRRRHAIQTNLQHMGDDMDLIFNIHRPSSLYDQTLR